jgi:nucleoside recognition membrane protein YjiH
MALRGILRVSESFYTFFLCLLVFLFLFLVSLALQRSNKKLSDDLEAMKAIVQSEYNQAKDVTEHAKEEIALARLIRRGADRDLV